VDPALAGNDYDNDDEVARSPIYSNISGKSFKSDEKENYA
jgi:hypothetical protein